MSKRPTTLVKGDPIQPELSSAYYLGSKYLREPRGDFSDSRLSAKLGSIGVDTLLLLPPDISGVSVDAFSEEPSIRITEIPELSRGRRNSRAKVQFGQLHIADPTTGSIAELVAAKYINRHDATREMNAARAVNNRFGENLAFQPVGFVKSKNGKTGYLSRYEHGVTSLDNILWNPNATESQRFNAMGFAGIWLANLHNHGFIHGDAQAKNMAYDPTFQPRYIDLEGARDMSHGRLDTETKRLLDIADLFNPVFMPATTPEEDAIFVDAYLDHQTKAPGRKKLTGEDIIDTIASVNEQSGRTGSK